MKINTIESGLVAFTLFFLFSCSSTQEDISTDVAVPVTVEEIKPRSIEQYISTTGTVYPTREVDLTSELSGNYTLLKNSKTGKRYALGDKVAKGVTIVAIEDEEYINELKIESLKLNLDISKREYEKQKSLYEKGGVTLLELKDAEVSYMDAKYSYENAELQLAKMKVKAPFTGVITDLTYYTQGTKIESDADLFTIMDYSELYMEVNLAEKNIDIANVDQEVRITNYTLPDDTLYGKITQISPAVDPDTRTFKGSLSIDNSELLLRPGMFVKAEIITAKKDSVIVISKDIILSKNRGKAVFVAEKTSARERIITTGLENPDEVEVVEGLKPNERLIIEGYETLRNRSKINFSR